MADTPVQDRKLRLPRTRSGDRFVTAYVPDLALQVCERLAQGETLTKICASEGMPGISTFRRWVVEVPELAEAVGRARELQAHSLFDEALDLAREVRTDKVAVSASRVRAFDVAMNHLRWSAGRLAPQTYSDRALITFVVPVQITTSVDLGQPGVTGGGEATTYEIAAKVVEEGVPSEPDQKKRKKA